MSKTPVLVAVVLGGCLAATGLGGCGSTVEAAAPARAKATVGSESPPASSYAPVQGAIDDLMDVRCSADRKGVWSFHAQLTNATSQERSYDVLVAVTKPRTSDVVGQKTFRATLRAGSSKTISDDRIYRGKGHLTCVPVVTLDE